MNTWPTSKKFNIWGITLLILGLYNLILTLGATVYAVDGLWFNNAEELTLINYKWANLLVDDIIIERSDSKWDDRTTLSGFVHQDKNTTSYHIYNANKVLDETDFFEDVKVGDTIKILYYPGPEDKRDWSNPIIEIFHKEVCYLDRSDGLPCLEDYRGYLNENPFPYIFAQLTMFLFLPSTILFTTIGLICRSKYKKHLKIEQQFLRRQSIPTKKWIIR